MTTEFVMLLGSIVLTGFWHMQLSHVSSNDGSVDAIGLLSIIWICSLLFTCYCFHAWAVTL